MSTSTPATTSTVLEVGALLSSMPARGVEKQLRDVGPLGAGRDQAPR